MKKSIRKVYLFTLLLILVIAPGCYGDRTGISTPLVTSIPTQQSNATPSVTYILTQPSEPTPLFSPTETKAVTYPPETRMKSSCLDVQPMPTGDLDSNGVLVLENRAISSEGFYETGSFHLDMKSDQMIKRTTAGENQIEHIVSPNRKLVAYQHVIYNTVGKAVKTELVVADLAGKPLRIMPWEEGWIEMPAWLDNEHLVINPSGLNAEQSAGEKPSTLLVLNPFSGERQILKPDFPRFLHAIYSSSLPFLPFWDGWSGVIYDPTLTRAIYPKFVGDNDEMYTYAIWDLSERRLIATLDEVFSSSSAFGGNFPMPKWSPDGSRFVFQGFDATTDPVKIELFEVSRDGQTKQLTQLSSVAYVWESSFSWSPDGRYIAMFLGPPSGAAFEKARVAVLDTVTLDVTDYCVSVTFSGDEYGGGGPLSPIWSPDGKQFVVMDWYEKNHRNVILVDIEKNSAAQIADDMEPVGWMIAP